MKKNFAECRTAMCNAMESLLAKVIHFNRDNGDNSLSTWKVVTSIACTTMLSKMSEEEMYELNDAVLDTLLYYVNPLAYSDDEMLDSFYMNEDIQFVWEKYLCSIKKPTFNIYLFLGETNDYADWREKLTSTLYKSMLDSRMDFVLIGMLWINCIHGRDLRLFNSGLTEDKYTVDDLIEDLNACTYVRRISGTDDAYISTFERKKESLITNLKQYGGMVIPAEPDYSCRMEVSSELSIGKSELLRAANAANVGGSDSSSSSSSTMHAEDSEEIQYRELATQYLKGVDYISEDEIEGIVDSAFINYSPELAYQSIMSTY